ncbi:MAG: hypothetical protein EOO15_02705 [Chitinophagaceae bacterium]|nr:MAG: hypothetical protein EOO15_02705 [Chitinophagaceae bacterium]
MVAISLHTLTDTASHAIAAPAETPNMSIQDIRFDDLGQAVYDLVPQSPLILLYAEFEPDVVLAALFYRSADAVVYVDPNDMVLDQLRKLQLEVGPVLKAFEFEMRQEKFKVSSTYADTFQSGSDYSDEMARRSSVLRKHFGHDQVQYPD